MMLKIFIAIVLMCLPLEGRALTPSEWIQQLERSPSQVIDQEIREPHIFYGLASYYNHVNYYVVEQKSIRSINSNDSIQLQKDQWLVIAGRFKVLALQVEGLDIQIEDEQLKILNPSLLHEISTKIIPTTKDILPSVAPELDQVRYAHLWAPFAVLSKGIELLMTIIFNMIGNWGITIVLFTLIFRVILLPVSLWTARLQRKVDNIKAVLIPQLDAIKSSYKGIEAHDRIMDAHKSMGISPFFTLKPMVGPLIQLPLLIAVFNAMGEMPQFASHSFLWIQDIAYPDTIMQLPFMLPLLGNELNLLPFLMTGVTVLSAVIFPNQNLPSSEVQKQKRNLYLMAFGFFLLFYSFPAAMVMLWTLASIFQAVQQKLIKV